MKHCKFLIITNDSEKPSILEGIRIWFRGVEFKQSLAAADMGSRLAQLVYQNDDMTIYMID